MQEICRKKGFLRIGMGRAVWIRNGGQIQEFWDLGIEELGCDDCF